MSNYASKTKDGTSSFFNSYADGFDSIYGSGTGSFQRWLNRRSRQSVLLRFEYTLAACMPAEGKSFLDVGCGPGHYGLALAQRGAKEILGLDFAPAMIELARAKARAADLEKVCRSEVRDFFQLEDTEVFDSVIMMGFLDYVDDAKLAVTKALNHARESAFFSFPASGGFLAWQRKLRYKRKCPLYLYSLEEIQDILSSLEGIRYKIRKLKRDFWVRVDKLPMEGESTKNKQRG